MRNFSVWKQRIRIAILAVLAADAGLFWFSSQIGGAAPEGQATQRDQLRRQHQLWGADVQRATDISTRLAEIEKDCNRFFDDQFLSEEVGSSTLVADLTAVASRAGLQARNISYKPAVLEKRNVIQMDISADVEGSYANIVRFINGLERSERFYVMEDLALGSAQGGELKLNLRLRTYFRMNRS